MDPAPTKDARAFGIVEYARLPRGNAFFGDEQFDLGWGIADRAQDCVDWRAGWADFDRDGQLDLVADTEIQIAATTIDINGAINASGEIIAASLDISGDVDVDGTLETDALSIASTTVTSTAAELNFSDGVTSNIQTQLDTKATTGKAIAMALVFG